MKNNKQQLIRELLVTISIIVGGFVTVYLLGRQSGEYSYILGAIVSVGAIFTFILRRFSYRRYKKINGDIPESDERSVSLMQKYLVIVFYFALFISSGILVILYTIGVKTIETNTLIIYMIILFVVIGIGAMLTRKA